MADLDEVALNVLLTEGIDPATAYAASIKDPHIRQRSISRRSRRIMAYGAIAGLGTAALLLWLF